MITTKHSKQNHTNQQKDKKTLYVCTITEKNKPDYKKWRSEILLPDTPTRSDLKANLQTLSSCELKALDYILFGYQRRSTRHFSIGKERIARYVGCSPRHVPRIIHKLRAYGLLDIFSQPEKKCNYYKPSNIFWDFKVRKQLHTILRALVFFPLWWVTDPIQCNSIHVTLEKRSYSLLNLEITPSKRKSLLISKLPIEKGTQSSDYVKNVTQRAQITTGALRPSLLLNPNKKLPYKKDLKGKDVMSVNNNATQLPMNISKCLRSVSDDLRLTRWGQIKFIAFSEDILINAYGKYKKSRYSTVNKFEHLFSLCLKECSLQKIAPDWDKMNRLAKRFNMKPDAPMVLAPPNRLNLKLKKRGYIPATRYLDPEHE